jgi:myosin heavy subunit
MPEYPDVPESEISVSILMEELKKREEHNRSNMAKRTALDQLNGEVAKQTEKVAQLEKELEEARTELEKVSKAQNELKVEVDALHDTDEQEIREQVTGAETINKKVYANKERSQILRKLRKKRGEYKKLTSPIEDIDKAKSDALASASFPVSDLSFDENGVLFNGLPFDQASSAEQLRVSVAIGLAMNPELKVLLIRDGSLLDRENLHMIASLAAEANAQVWIERVGEGDEVSIIIEDGMIKTATKV